MEVSFSLAVKKISVVTLSGEERRGVGAGVEAYLVTLDVTFSYSSKFHHTGKCPQTVI